MSDIQVRAVSFFVGVAAFPAVARLARWLGSCPSYDGQEPDKGSAVAPIILGIGIGILVVAILAGCAHARRRVAPPPAIIEPDDVVEQVGYVGEKLWAAAIRRNRRFFTIFTMTGQAAEEQLDWRLTEKWAVVWMSGGDDVAPEQIVIGDANGKQVLLLRWRQKA